MQQENHICGVLDERFVLSRTLGCGLTCKVKLARDLNTNKLYAVKIFFSEEFNSCANSEIESLQKLKHHPSIIKLYGSLKGVLKSKGKPDRVVNYLVLEYVPGGELFDFI